jgi:heme A synthase
MSHTRFAKYAWGVLLLNIFVILWGAYVRASGSGAGCGSHWPLCNGQVVPQSPKIETLIEFTHRLSSGLAFLFVLGLLVWAIRAYPKGDLIRLAAGLAFAFMMAEALIGAGLVLFKWVARDESTGRAISIVVHLVNTFFLLASITLTAWLASQPGRSQKEIGRMMWTLLSIGLVGMIILGASGALTALGDTLFPAQSLSQGLQQDFSPTAHFLIRLRVFHPTLAAVVGMYLLILAAITRLQFPSPEIQGIARMLTVGVLLQLGAGVLNLLLLAPVWMQIVHLLLAVLVWIVLVLLTYSSLGLGYNSGL